MWSAASVLVCALSVLGRQVSALPLIDCVEKPSSGVLKTTETFTRSNSNVICIPGLRPSDCATAPVHATHPLATLLARAKPGRAAPGPRRSVNRTLGLSCIASPDLVGRPSGEQVCGILGAIGVNTDWVLEERSSMSSSPLGANPPMTFIVHALIVASAPGPFLSDEALLGVTPPGNHDRWAEILSSTIPFRNWLRYRRGLLRRSSRLSWPTKLVTCCCRPLRTGMRESCRHRGIGAHSILRMSIDCCSPHVRAS